MVEAERTAMVHEPNAAVNSPPAVALRSAPMPHDMFFEHKTPTGTTYAEVRYSHVSDSCVVRVLDQPAALVAGGRDDVEYEVDQRVAGWKEAGFKAVKQPTLPAILTP